MHVVCKGESWKDNFVDLLENIVIDPVIASAVSDAINSLEKK